MTRLICVIALALATTLMPVYAQEEGLELRVDKLIELLQLDVVLKENVTEQDIDALKIYLKDLLAGQQPVLPDDTRQRLTQAAKRLNQRAGPLVDLLLDYAAVSAKRALQEAKPGSHSEE